MIMDYSTNHNFIVYNGSGIADSAGKKRTKV
jgi:hypothetical protein